jgi:F0F1-type ATP synthase membrane subunit c/vacuolar-type H+-ATPase subunit K
MNFFTFLIVLFASFIFSLKNFNGLFGYNFADDSEALELLLTISPSTAEALILSAGKIGLVASGLSHLGAGVALLSIAGVGTGIGLIFGSACVAISFNPVNQKEIQTLAMLGFALVEALGLLCLLIAFMLLFS